MLKRRLDRYCSVEHMQYDWSTHRSYCRPFEGSTEPSVGGSSTAASSQVPSPNNQYSPLLPIAPRDTSGRGPPPNGPGFQQAPLSTHPINGTRNMSPSGPATTSEFDSVLFPWNEERPRIVRVPCLAQPQNSGPTIWTPMPQEQLGGIENITSMIITHGIGGAPLRFPLHLFYGSASFGDGSPINRTIERMTGGKATYPWAGQCRLLSPRLTVHFADLPSVNPNITFYASNACSTPLVRS